MPEIINNIYLDTSFIEPSDDNIVSDVGVLFKVDDNIGEVIVPTVFNINEVSSAEADTTVDILIQELETKSDDAWLNFTYSTIVEDSKDILSSYFTIAMTSSEVDCYAECFLVNLFEAGLVLSFKDMFTSYIAGEKYASYNDYPSSSVFFQEVTGYNDAETEYLNFSGNYEDAGPAIPTIDLHRDYLSAYYAGKILDTPLYNDSYVDLLLSGWVMHYISSVVQSVDEGIKSINQDVRTVDGKVNSTDISVTSCDQGIKHVSSDVFSCAQNLKHINTEASAVIGNIINTPIDVFSTDEKVTNITCDIQLQSTKIHNFSIDVQDYFDISSGFYVDVVDDKFTIDTLNTDMFIDDIEVSYIAVPITDGYRLIYDSDEFLYGQRNITITSMNSDGDVYTKSYKTTSGFELSYKNKDLYSYADVVDIRIASNNLESGRFHATDGGVFETIEMRSLGLSATISPMSGVESSDISAEIYADSNAYFYGKEFTVTIKAKDFAGNEMEPFTFSYRIEDAPK